MNRKKIRRRETVRFVGRGFSRDIKLRAQRKYRLRWLAPNFEGSPAQAFGADLENTKCCCARMDKRKAIAQHSS
jgi:hypothetical protein